MSVHYKFKSALDFDTIIFDGLHISVGDLKKSIVHQKRLGKTHDFDLQITNAQTKEEYLEDTCLIPKNTSLIIARIPLTTQYKKQWDPQNQQQQNQPDKSHHHHHQPAIEKSDNANLDLSRMNGSEEDKIQAMIMQSTMEYDPQNYQKVRNSTQIGEVPPNYRCYRCNKTGHWIKNCPMNAIGKDPHYHYKKFNMDGPKKMTGIPRTFINQQQQQQQPDQQQPQIEQKQKIPEDLICSICEDLFTDAVMTPCCGMSFCDECVRTALLESEENECPDCKEKGTSPGSLIPNRFLRNSVNSFRNETGYIKMRQNKPQIEQEEGQEYPEQTSENIEQTDEVAVENNENYTHENQGENQENFEQQEGEPEINPDGNFDAENDNAYQGDEGEDAGEIAGEGKDQEYGECDDRDQQTSDDDDNITVTVPPAHMQVRGAFRDRHHRRHHHDHNENYNQNQNVEGNSNPNSSYDDKDHSEEGHDYKYRHHSKKPMQIPSVSSNYRDDMPGNGTSGNTNQNYPPTSNPQSIPSNSDSQDHYHSNQSGYHGNPAPQSHHPSQQQPQMHGHYPPQQVPYGPPHYGAPMGMRPVRYDPHGGYRHPGPHPGHMVRPGFHGHDPYMPRQRHIAPAVVSAARTVHQQFGTGIIEDPLAAFNRIMHEREMRKERSRRSPDRDRRSRSFERKRSPVYSPDNHRKSPERRSEDRNRRRHRSSSYGSDSSRSFSRSRSRSRKRVARRRSRSRSHSPARFPKRRDNYSKDHYREDRHRSPERYRGRGGYRGRSGRGGYYNRGYDNNRQSDNYQSYSHHSKPNDNYQNYQDHQQQQQQQQQQINQQNYNMDGYTNPFEPDPRSGKGGSPNSALLSHPYEVPVHTMESIEEQPPPPGFETLPKEEELSKKPPLTSNELDEHNQKSAKNDSFDSGANLPDTTDRKYLSEEETTSIKRSDAVKEQKERSRERKGDHKKSHSRHHSDRKQREKIFSRETRESSTDDGKRDKKSKDKKKRKKSKETEKKKSKKDRKDKDKDKEKRHHHKEEKEILPDEGGEKEVKSNNVEDQEPDIPTTVSNTNENSMEAPDSSTMNKEVTEFTPPVQETMKDSIDKVEDQNSDQFQFNRSDSVLDIYANLDFDGDGDLEEEEAQSPQKSTQPMPELSKWERDEEQPETQVKSSDKPNEPDESESDQKEDKVVTSEVIKRAENAIIFSRAINAIRPLEIKKISADRLKLYSNPSVKEQSPKPMEQPATPEFKTTETVQITVPADESGSRSVEIKTEIPQKAKISPIRTSVKDRLGIKITEKKPSRSRTPKRKPLIMSTTTVRSNVSNVQKKRSRTRSKSRGRGDYKQPRKDDRNVRSDRIYDRNRDAGKIRSRHSSSAEKDRKRERDRPKESDRDRERERERERERRERERSRRSSRDRRERDSRTSRVKKSRSPAASSPHHDSRKEKESVKKQETEDPKKSASSSAVDSSTTKPAKPSKEEPSKKRHRSSSPSSRSSSDSESSADSDDSSKHHKKHSKKSKKKRSSSTDSHDSSSKRKKLKKNKKAVKKKKKSKK